MLYVQVGGLLVRSRAGVLAALVGGAAAVCLAYVAPSSSVPTAASVSGGLGGGRIRRDDDADAGWSARTVGAAVAGDALYVALGVAHALALLRLACVRRPTIDDADASAPLLPLTDPSHEHAL